WAVEVTWFLQGLPSIIGARVRAPSDHMFHHAVRSESQNQVEFKVAHDDVPGRVDGHAAPMFRGDARVGNGSVALGRIVECTRLIAPGPYAEGRDRAVGRYAPDAAAVVGIPAPVGGRWPAGVGGGYHAFGAEIKGAVGRACHGIHFAEEVSVHGQIRVRDVPSRLSVEGAEPLIGRNIPAAHNPGTIREPGCKFDE